MLMLFSVHIILITPDVKFFQLHRSLRVAEIFLTENAVNRCQSTLSVIFSAAFSVYVETVLYKYRVVELRLSFYPCC